MKKRRNFRSAEKGLGASIAISLAVTLLTILLFSLAAALILMYTEYPIGTVGKASLAVIVISGGVCGFLNARLFRERGARTAIIPAAAVGALMAILTVAVGGSASTGRALMNCGCFIAVNALFALLGIKKAKRRLRRH